MNKLMIRLCTAALTCLTLISLPSFSQTVYPDKPVRLVVPFPAGGPTDIFARLVAKKLSDDFGQQFFVENTSGAGGILGMQNVAKSRPDGYTMLFASASIAIVPSLYSTLSFDPSRDLDPIALAGVVPMILVTHADGPASAKALIDSGKANPEKFSYASAGNGTATHLASEAFKTQFKLNTLHVPYRGTAPALTDVVAGRHLFIFDYIGPIKPYLSNGPRLRVLAIASEKRSPMLPNVPTFAEAGLTPFISSTWNMFFVPAQTPRPVVMKLNAALNNALKDQQLSQRLAELGIGIVSDSTPESSRAFMQEETKRWSGIVKSSGAKLD